MENIKYRAIEEKDYNEVGEILNQAFGLFKYMPDEKMLENFKLQYVYSCLTEATYTSVAEKDGRVVGIIMGNAKSDYNVFSHFSYIFKTILYSLKMGWHGRKYKKQMKEYKKLHRIYHEFSKKHKNDFDGVLTLFAVDKDCQGLGVGKTLLKGLFEYLKKQNIKNIYLYTDTTCNYNFYEHRGFKRLEEQTLELTREEKNFQMDVFLYNYNF